MTNNDFKLFLRFLKENNIYSKYFKHITKKDKIYNYSVDEIISNSFKWSDTEDGFIYWANVEKNWFNLINNLNER